jgi:hypothetical protein
MLDNYNLKNLMADKKKKLNSRSKGNTFERKICAIFNEFFETQEFIRSPGSGAFSTTHRLPEHLRFSGDLITPKIFKFTIECKKGYNKENIGSIFNPRSNIISFIDQAEKDSDKINKNFLLIFQQDRKNVLCLFNENNSIALSAMGEKKDHIFIRILNKSYIICRLEDLLDTTKKESARALWL